MANIYMNIENFSPKGVATLKGPKGAFMAINSYSWETSRNIGMDVGNVNNRSAGIGTMSGITITRELDGATNALLTSVFKFDNIKGKKMTFIFVRPKADGSGADIYYQVELEGARIASYHLVGKNDSKPHEEIGIVYNKISITHNSADALGIIKKGAATVFDVPTGVLEAGADLK